MKTSGAPSAALEPATFGAALRFLRLRAQLSQHELAAAVGYSEGAISRLENNRRRPVPEVVAARFVAALGIADDPGWTAQLLALASGPPATQPRLPARPSSPPVLALKLRVPPLPVGMLPRERLAAQLERAAKHALTVVCAPAGSGKTTLLAAWAARRRATGLAVAWLTLDQADDDLGAFTHLLVAALRTVAPAVGETTLALLQMPERPTAAALLTPLLNDLLGAAPPCILILDDLHVLSAPEAHQALRLLVDHAPPQLQLVLASRTAPPLPLARLRARRQVGEIGAADLGWHGAEAAALFPATLGLELGASEVAALVERTEGWTTGLLLAGLALRDHPDRRGLIRTFTGSSPYVADYLADEVIAGLPPHLQWFIVRTALLDQLSGPLCDALLRDARGDAPAARSGQQQLEEIEQRQLFIAPLDETRTWYRYHRLFRDVLQRRLADEVPWAEQQQLNHRASAWYAAADMIAEALQHALAAGDTPAAVRLIEQRAPRLLEHGDVMALQRWIALLPADIVRQRPRLCLAAAIAATATDNHAAIEPLLERAVALSAAAVTGAEGDATWLDRTQLVAQLVGATLAMQHHDPLRALALARAVAADPAAAEPFLSAWATWDIGTAALALGDIATATTALAELQTMAVPDYPAMYLQATLGLGLVALLAGQLQRAAALYEQALERAERDRWPMLAPTAQIHLRLGAVYLEKNKLAEAVEQVEQAIHIATSFKGPVALLLGYMVLAQIRDAQGATAAAEHARARRDALLRTVPPALLAYLRTEHYAGILLVPAASAAAQQPELPGGAPLARAVARLEWARQLVARGADADAEQEIAATLGSVSAPSLAGLRLQLTVLTANIQLRRDGPAAAFPLVDEALAIAPGEDYVRSFAPLNALLVRRAAAPNPPPALWPLLEALGHAPGVSAARPEPSTASAAAIDETRAPLTRREHDVVRLLAAGASNTQIADELRIAVGTVKRHLVSIFAKLEVSNRTQATIRVRQLALLDAAEARSSDHPS